MGKLSLSLSYHRTARFYGSDQLLIKQLFGFPHVVSEVLLQCSTQCAKLTLTILLLVMLALPSVSVHTSQSVKAKPLLKASIISITESLLSGEKARVKWGEFMQNLCSTVFKLNCNFRTNKSAHMNQESSYHSLRKVLVR